MNGFRLLLPIAAVSMRRRWPAFVGSFVALALGVAVMSAAGLLLNTTMGEDSLPGAPSLHKLVGFMAAMAGFVSVFVVSSTFAFAVAQRRQETAMLRAVGATPRQVRALVLGEALVVALAAAVSGCAIGLLVAPAIAAWLVDQGAAPSGFHAEPAPLPLLFAASGGLVVALLGAYAASRRAGRVRPVEALNEVAVDKKVMPVARWVAAVLFLGVFGYTLWTFIAMPASMLADPQSRDPETTPQWALLFDVMAVLAIVLIAPVLVPPLVRLFTVLVPLLPGAAGLIARQNALAAIRRTVSTATPVFLVIGLAGSVVGGTVAFADAMAAQGRAALKAGYVIEPSDGRGVPAEALRALAALPDARLTTATTVRFDGLATPDQQPAPGRPNDLPIPEDGLAVDGDLRTAWNLSTEGGSLEDLHGRTVAVSDDMARVFGWHVGDTLNARLADGTQVQLRLVARVRHLLPHLPEIVVPREAVPGPSTATGPSAVSVAYLGTGASPEQVTAALGGSAARATTGAQWIGAHNDRTTKNGWIAMLAILGPALLYALIAIVNTMMMSTGDRLRDFATLRLTGGTRRQVLRVVAVETLLVVATAAALGLVVTLLTQYATVLLIGNRILDPAQSAAFDLPWGALAGATAVCLVLAMVSSLVPARLALRIRPLDLASGRQ
ncbi:FtsX-like permease family protein [Streptomyces sp. 1331.2]|uniref:FtsX-like permease family protein n=1 Tax=Streptomyces sp. 1331.2 TaxID=1938835 RepID=UPI000BD00045|nr:ABC transporter permease [Streptomyces sp. 1331.2]SOB83298.1 putative ABC transport system permease protein [Streptomyces sp. 1331.2]